MKKIEEIRTNYNLASIQENDFTSSPIDQFRIWFNEIVDKIITSSSLCTWLKYFMIYE